MLFSVTSHLLHVTNLGLLGAAGELVIPNNYYRNDVRIDKCENEDSRFLE